MFDVWKIVTSTPLIQFISPENNIKITFSNDFFQCLFLLPGTRLTGIRWLPYGSG